MVGLRNVLSLKSVFLRNGLRANGRALKKRGSFLAIFIEVVFLNIYIIARASQRLASSLCEQKPKAGERLAST